MQVKTGRWARLATVGQAHWFFGNLYEAVVDVPRLTGDRSPGLLASGSPARYFIPAAPATIASTALALTGSWHDGGDRRAIVTAAAGTAVATGITVHLVRSVNLTLLREQPDQARREELAKKWHRANLVRLALLIVVRFAFRRATADRRR
ncbi:anthrone oxygenase family protein [Amycolatopsis thailandensis]|uniref:anthrone oxygenase family protein n=1 Tax=Amycolatopsis thailandensis TaxID=589330 RepID=UPI0037900F98